MTDTEIGLYHGYFLHRIFIASGVPFPHPVLFARLRLPYPRSKLL